MIAAGAAAAALFFVLWWMLQSEEYPWVPAGLAASVVMLVAASAREVVMRRAWTRYILERDKRDQNVRANSGHSTSGSADLRSPGVHATALRALQKESTEADAPDALPEAHLDAYNLCKDYLAGTDEAMRSATLRSESRVALRAGQERVRALQKHHLLAWACDASRALTHEAQQRARLSEKIELANRALDCIDAALKAYPDEGELNESVRAIREFITSSKVAHWVELAERAAFKGYYLRAIDCYRDALFYLTRESLHDENNNAAAERIFREVELLRARIATEGGEAHAKQAQDFEDEED
jgi:tetratricopeptide (TPR) repeat protein